MKNNSILVKLQYFLLFLYFISIFVYRLGTDIDVLFFRLSFGALVVVTLVVSKFKLKITSHTKWFMAFWAFYFISLLWTSNRADTMELFNNFIYLLGLTYVLNDLINTKEDIDKVLKIYIASMIYMTVILLIRTPISAWGSERVGSVIGINPNHIGFRLAVSTIFVRYLLSNIVASKGIENKKIKVIFCLMLIVLFGTVALLTGSKMAMLLLFLFLGIYEILARKGAKKLKIIALVIFAMIIIIYQIFNNPMLYNVLGRRIEAAINTVMGTSINNQDVSSVERQFFIDKAKILFKNNPIIGYGGNNFKSYMRQIGYNHVTYSHNNYLEILSGLGVVGFIIYYLFILIVLLKLIKCFKKNNDKNVLLMMVILIGGIFKDYNVVNYYDETNHIIIMLAYFTYYFRVSEKTTHEKEGCINGNNELYKKS